MVKVYDIKTRKILFSEDIDYSGLPEGVRSGIQMYIEHRIPPGHFLTAVLANDLFGACDRADLTNQGNLYAIAKWLYNNAPSGCYGSPEKVDAWLSV